jgi:Pathogenicity locus
LAETTAALVFEGPYGLYASLQSKTGQRHDPCVWDMFAAAIHQARTGEARDWWTFTQERKRRERKGRASESGPAATALGEF